MYSSVSRLPTVYQQSTNTSKEFQNVSAAFVTGERFYRLAPYMDAGFSLKIQNKKKKRKKKKS